MKTKATSALRIFPVLLAVVLMAGLATAQQYHRATAMSEPKKKSTDTKKPDETKTVPIRSRERMRATIPLFPALEIGYRGLTVGGDLNKYQSDLNYRAGPRLFDSSFLMKSKDGKGELFDTLLVTSTGWGADPQGNFRVSVEKPEWYRFEGTYRRFKYFRFLNSFANPNWVFSPATFSVPPNPVTGSTVTTPIMNLGDFDLTLLPKNERIRFNIGYSPERYSGPAFTNYHAGGNEFNFLIAD